MLFTDFNIHLALNLSGAANSGVQENQCVLKICARNCNKKCFILYIISITFSSIDRTLLLQRTTSENNHSRAFYQQPRRDRCSERTKTLVWQTFSRIFNQQSTLASTICGKLHHDRITLHPQELLLISLANSFSPT